MTTRSPSRVANLPPKVICCSTITTVCGSTAWTPPTVPKVSSYRLTVLVPFRTFTPTCLDAITLLQSVCSPSVFTKTALVRKSTSHFRCLRSCWEQVGVSPWTKLGSYSMVATLCDLCEIYWFPIHVSSLLWFSLSLLSLLQYPLYYLCNMVWVCFSGGQIQSGWQPVNFLFSNEL